MDEFSISRNYRSERFAFDALLLPRFEHVRRNGHQLTAWLNDFFVSDGGGGTRVSPAEIEGYADAFLSSRIDGAIIHEAAFLLESDCPEAAWKQLRRLAG